MFASFSELIPEHACTALPRRQVALGGENAKHTPAWCFRDWQAKTHVCAVFSRRQGGIGRRKRAPAQCFRGACTSFSRRPRDTGRRKRTPAQCFRCAKRHWQSKPHACAVFGGARFKAWGLSLTNPLLERTRSYVCVYICSYIHVKPARGAQTMFFSKSS